LRRAFTHSEVGPQSHAGECAAQGRSIRLGERSARLGRTDWLDGAFSAADILMVHVLRKLEGSGPLDEYPNLAAYIARADARPAFKRAFDPQLPVFIAAPNG